MSVTQIKLKMNPVRKLNFFLFNIEGYGEFFSGITPAIDPEMHCFLYNCGF